VAAALMSAPPARATTLALGDIADNHVIQDTPTTNYGASSKLWVTLKATKTESQPYFLFDLSSVPASAVITTATLGFTALPNPAGTALNTSGVTIYQTATAGASFGELTETWNNRPAAGTTSVSTGPINISSSQTSVAVSVNVASLLRPGMQNTLIMRPQQPTGGWTMPIASKEATASQRPSLSVSYSVTGAPSVTNVGAGNVQTTSATVSAGINPQGYDTTYRFDYGTSTSYGSSVPVPDADIGTGSATVLVSQAIGGLTPSTTYHYHVVATNLGGTTTTPDATFTTAAPPTPPAVGSLSSSNLQPTTATLSAVVNAQGYATTYHFEYGMDLSDPSSVVSVPSPDGSAGSGTTDQTYTQSIRGLSPGATYQWRVVATNVAGTTTSAVLTFVAPQSPVADPVIAAAGDVSCNDGTVSIYYCRQKAVSDLILADPSVTAVLGLGDLQYDCGSLVAYTDPLNYNGTWGRFKSITYPSAGNHDYTFDSPDPDCQGRSDPDPATGYFQYFGNAATPLQPGCTQYCKGYYSFDKGNWHIVSLNSCWAHYMDDAGVIRVDGCLSGTAQYNWLVQDLASVPTSKCVLIYDHYPRWSSGAHGDIADMNDMWNLMVADGVDVFLSGHDHDYERFAQIGANAGGALMNTATPDPNGVRQFIVGTGGAGHNAFAQTYHLSGGDNTSQVRDAHAFGFLKMTLHANSYDWQFVGDPTVSTFTDSGSTACHN
jgi:hypothetical protein